MAPLPRFTPMLLSSGGLPAGLGPAAIEPKWDGVRCMTYLTGERLHLETRRGRAVTAQVPELEPMVGALAGHDVVLDGELVALDAVGSVDFYGTLRRLAVSRERAVAWARQRSPLTLVVFDVLWLDGESLIAQPYSCRRNALESLELAGPAWHTTPSYLDRPADVFAACCDAGLEGVVVKALDSPYRPGVRSRAWIKHKSADWRRVHEHRRRPRFAGAHAPSPT